jgi:hypothetical protein
MPSIVRQQGYYEWHSQVHGYGLILGDEAKSTFPIPPITRPRTKGRQGWQAYDVQPAQKPEAARPDQGQAAGTQAIRSTGAAEDEKPGASADLQFAAQEALRLKRERREGIRDYFNCHRCNQSLSRLAGRFLLRAMLNLNTQGVIEDLREFVHLNESPDQVVFGGMTPPLPGNSNQE